MYDNIDYSNLSLYGFLVKLSESRMDLEALEYFGKKFTYSSLINNIDKTANALIVAGVKKGDKVSICLPNTPEAVFSFYAINKIGAIANMIHPMSAENEIVHYLTVSESDIIIGLDLVSNKIAKAMEKTNTKKLIVVSVKESMPFFLGIGYSIKSKKPDIPLTATSWKEFMAGASSVNSDNLDQVSGDDCAAILYSGGTTGKPKGIMLSNYNFNALAVLSIEACRGLKEGMRFFAIMPIFHGFGLGVGIHSALVLGGVAVILPSFKASEFHKLLMKYRPNLIAAVPAIYESMIKHKDFFAGKDLSFLKVIISGGDSLSLNTKKKVDDLLKSCNCDSEVREGYGMTESVTGSCLLPVGISKPGSCGFPYSEMTYRIVDPKTNEEVPTGEVGEITYTGPTIMIGYLNDKEETDNTIKVDEQGRRWLHTGDIGYIDEDGFVYFKQRLKRMIVSGGYNIYPQIIENVIDSHPDVLASAVVGVPDTVMGEICKAVIEFKSQDVDKDKALAEIKDACKQNVARYALPREYIAIEHMPRTLVGKIAYNELIEMYKDKQN